MKKFFAPLYVDEVKKVEAEQVKKEWVWVEGYKGTDRDMQCRGFQFELNKQFDIPEGEEVKTCENGFHMCLNLNDVYDYYEVGNNNRFFKVRALVRKSDCVNYGSYETASNSDAYFFKAPYRINKLAAKSIVFVEELTVDEILKPFMAAKDFSDKHKKLALTVGVDETYKTMRCDTLVELGYSKPFARYIIDNGKYETARAVGSQPDLSMDMKCMIIFQ